MNGGEGKGAFGRGRSQGHQQVLTVRSSELPPKQILKLYRIILWDHEGGKGGGGGGHEIKRRVS